MQWCGDVLHLRPSVPYNGEDNNDYADGEVVQHIEYVPFGEVFAEERNNIWNTPYLYNAKEFDEETELYYYGARYYDPRLSLWISTDALKEKTPNVSPYIYTDNNPIIYIVTLSVVGAEVGVPLAGIGNTISGAAGITGMLIDAVNGDWADQ